MEGSKVDDSHVLLLYSITSESEEKARQAVIEAVRAVCELDAKNVTIKYKDGKYSAYISLPADKAQTLEEKKTIKIAETTVNLKRYYSDFQLYINKLPNTITAQDVKKYFQKFGNVLDTAINVVSLEKKGTETSRHCFIKFQEEKSVDDCFLQKHHEIKEIEVRVARTFKIGENEETDKKIFFKFENSGQENLEAFEQAVNEHFMTYGFLRERIRLEHVYNKAYRVCISYTTAAAQEAALKKFQKIQFKKAFNIAFDILPWNPNKDERGDNKIFLSGLRGQVTEEEIKGMFQTFGEIINVTINLTRRNNTKTAIITFLNKSSEKTALADYVNLPNIDKIYIGEPYATTFLSPNDRKSLATNYNKKETPATTQPPQNMLFMNNMPMYGPTNPGYMPYPMGTSPMGVNPQLNNPQMMGIPPMGVNTMGSPMGGNPMGVSPMGVNISTPPMAPGGFNNIDARYGPVPNKK